MANDTNTTRKVYLQRTIWVLCSLVLLFGLWFWYNRVIYNPNRVFAGMLENNLSTRNFGKLIRQSDQYQQMLQRVQVKFVPETLAHGFVELKQKGGNITTTVLTEALGSPGTDYVRYLDIDTNQPSFSGEPLNFSDVLGVWSKTEQTGVSGRETAGELFGEASLGVAPIGYIKPQYRDQLVDYIIENNIYEFDSNSVKVNKDGSRPTMVYSIKMQPAKYVRMLKMFAEQVGLTQLKEVDPDLFEDSPALNFDFEIDVWSRQLVGIQFEETGRSENYGSWGGQFNVATPDETISIEELEGRLRSIR